MDMKVLSNVKLYKLINKGTWFFVIIRAKEIK